MLTEDQKKEIKEHALGVFPEEACGLIVQKNDHYLLVKSKNEAKQKKRFRISAERIVAASEQGKIVGFYHSHPSDNESFSELDKKNIFYHKWIGVLYCCGKDSFHTLRPEEISEVKTFCMGSNDCFELLRVYYKEKLGLFITDYYRNQTWQTFEPDLIERYYKREGFVEVKLEEIKLHDVVLFAPDKEAFAGHIGIFVGNNEVFHFSPRWGVVVDEYSEGLRSKTKLVLRHTTQL